LFAALLLVTGCAAASPHKVLKLGVIAPFEGAGRPLGYAVLPAIKQVVADANARGDFGDRRVLVVAFNDDLDPATAAGQAHALALDPDVVAVVGPFTAETAAAVAPILAAAGIPHAAIPSAAPSGQDHAAEIAAAAAATRTLLAGSLSRQSN
jgi:ABC-type branched-subunit amino acid transport system substrate-binding protein